MAAECRALTINIGTTDAAPQNRGAYTVFTAANHNRLKAHGRSLSAEVKQLLPNEVTVRSRKVLGSAMGWQQCLEDWWVTAGQHCHRAEQINRAANRIVWVEAVP